MNLIFGQGQLLLHALKRSLYIPLFVQVYNFKDESRCSDLDLGLESRSRSFSMHVFPNDLVK